jgi:hypothetical protein
MRIACAIPQHGLCSFQDTLSLKHLRFTLHSCRAREKLHAKALSHTGAFQLSTQQGSATTGLTVSRPDCLRAKRGGCLSFHMGGCPCLIFHARQSQLNDGCSRRAKRCASAATMFNVGVRSLLCSFMSDCSKHHRLDSCKPWKQLVPSCHTAAILGPSLTTLKS